MSHEIIVNNINRLLKLKDWKFSDLERRMEKNKSLGNILRGSSINPTIEVLRDIANAFDVSLSEIVFPSKVEENINLNLFSEVSSIVLQELQNLNHTIKYSQLTRVLDEVYNCTLLNKLPKPDKAFVQWYLNKVLYY